MSYLLSTDVNVFPSTRRASYQLSARQLSEARIAGIINQLIDREGFVITTEEKFAKDLPFEFNIHGYYFRINELRNLINAFTDSTDIYAAIKLQYIPDTDYIELVGQDDAHKAIPDGDDGVYYGVQFSNTKLSGEGVICLHLLTRKNISDKWNIVVNSWFKFDSRSLNFKVDGGEI